MLNPYLLVLAVYSLLLIGIGARFTRVIRDSSDFFVAGRKLGSGLLFSTLLAANIGAGSTVGAAGLGYRLGLSGWWWVGSAGIGSLFLAFFIGPRIRDLAERHGLFTVGDFLELRYGKSVRILAAALLWLATPLVLAAQLIALAWILDVIAGIPKPIACLLGGGVVIAYFSAGGLKGTVWINLVQLAVKGAAFLVVVPLALSAAGGWEQVQARAASSGNPDYASVVGIGPAAVLAYVFLLAPSFITSPGLVQKVYGARNARAVRWGAGLQGVVLLGYSFLPVLLGMSAATVFPNLENSELALPYVMTHLVPFWIGALLLAAVFSAEVSSADAALFMLATSLSKDFYKAVLNPTADEKQLLRVSRWVSVLAGAAAVALAIFIPSVISALSIFYGLLSVALFVPLVLGLYRSLPGRRACLIAIAVSLAVAALVHLLTAGQGYSIFSPTAVGILMSLLLMLAAGRIERVGQRNK
ncbi:MAG: sodium:solute symporter family protein [Acidobacteria bacterium]|nr:sodium:solute symporter family protein [Acidobacteriota bacterium]